MAEDKKKGKSRDIDSTTFTSDKITTPNDSKSSDSWNGDTKLRKYYFAEKVKKDK